MRENFGEKKRFGYGENRKVVALNKSNGGG